MDLPQIDADKHVLIAGPTASGKSSLALRIAESSGGIIVNADASQVFDCWRLITARPSAKDEARAPHHLYGHKPYDAQYSVGHWIRDVEPLLKSGERLIIVGGTGLYFSALTEGIAEIPETPSEIRTQADQRELGDLISELDKETQSRIDLKNRARVQRAWEVLATTGKPLAQWQDDTPPPRLPRDKYTPLVLQSPKEWLEPRIRGRFQEMVRQGALDEVRAMGPRFDPALPSCKAIGVPELIAHEEGTLTLSEAIEKSVVSTRRYAKRQRTWFRARMSNWHPIHSQEISTW